MPDGVQVTATRMTQVEQVRIRLLHHATVAKLRQRGIDPEELRQVVDIVIERHGLHAVDLESRLEAHYNSWRRDPRMTLSEYVRQLHSNDDRH